MRYRKFLSFGVAMWLAVTCVMAQTDCIVPMMVLAPDSAGGVPSGSWPTLQAKMRQMLTASGIEGGARYSQFCLGVRVTEDAKEVLSGMKPLITLKLQVEFFVGNNFSHDVLTSTVVSLTGAGRNEATAYRSAFSRLNTSEGNLRTFIQSARTTILDYYSSHQASLVRQARQMSAMGEFEEAMCLLASIPQCCVAQGSEAEVAMLEAYQAYLEDDCAKKILRARAIWEASQTPEAAREAGAYLSAIRPNSACAAEMNAVFDAIRQRIGEQWELEKKQAQDVVDIEKSRIEAARAVGVAYGNHQKSATVHEHWLMK